MIATTVRGRARGRLSSTERRRLGRRLERAMAAAGVGSAELSLSLVDDDEIRALNRDYRRRDRPTDVLSFSMREGEGAIASALLGDVVISVDTARRQAEAAGRPLDDELLHLAVHGLAHLLGYDHATAAEERVMFGYEAQLRAEAERRGPVRTVQGPPVK